MRANINKKAQALIISLWILVILTLLAINTGHRVSIGLRLSRYSKERIKAYSLARAGIQRGIMELENDKNQYDALSETWSTGRDPLTNSPLFENKEVKEASGEVFTVRYLYDKDKNTYLCMEDEERKININSADKPKLSQLFILNGIGVSEAEKLAETIIDWIDADSNAIAGGPEEGSFKNSTLAVPEELLVALGYFYVKSDGDNETAHQKAQEIYRKIEDSITVWGEEGKININTVSPEVLKILANSVAQNDGERGCVVAVVNEILRQRDEKKYFTTLDGIINDELVEGISSDINLFNNGLQPNLVTQSNYFRIESTGNAGKVSKRVTAVYDRGKEKIVYWHED